MSAGRPTREYIDAMLRRLAANGQIEHIAVVVKMADHPAAYTYLSTADDAETREMATNLGRAYQPLKAYR